ncbi:hypothetical protein EZV62_024853 [Acer yangbiense]|uniref:Heparan-alpha-glucosaminide N-acetyltransferase catalytic domain-containing protein n=1 Tax=Acer yangbiense TaxID=1000413 RepID=A0A5C7GW69_9ROSI|nr:hypothetical protein EZV62_024853 [Acer yangbiense]
MAAENEPINENNGNGDMVIQISRSVKAKPSVVVKKSEEQNPLIANSKQEQQQNQRQRLVSLDVFRGITVALMILVDDAGGLLPAINHSPWNGGFLHRVNDLNYGVDMEQIRWTGVLQRIAVAYIVAALCEIWLKDDDHHVKCGVRGNTGPACNVVGMIDRKILGIRHLYRRPTYARTEQCSTKSPDNGPLPPGAPSWCQAPFDPEGLLSSVMAIVTCLVGLHYGHLIIHFKDHKDRILSWTISSSCLICSGLAMDLFGMHINKALYTFSYMCVTAGAAGILFTGIYYMVDVCGYKRSTLVFEWIGLHALMIYILAACNVLPVVLQGFYWRQPQNNIVGFVFPALSNYSFNL